MTDEAVREALRAYRTDETDRLLLARLVVELWRAGHLRDGYDRSIQPMFRLTGVAYLSKRDGSMWHPWPLRNGRASAVARTKNHVGLWWTVGPGPWRTEAVKGDRVWIMPCIDTGRCVWGSKNRCLPFDSVGELADYLGERAIEWKVVEPKPKKVQPEVVEPRPEPKRIEMLTIQERAMRAFP